MRVRLTSPGARASRTDCGERLSAPPVPSSPIAPLTYAKAPSRLFAFPPALRQYHMQVLGKPGGGKTKFLEACVRQDIRKRHGVLLIDPAGNLYNDVVGWCEQQGYLRTRPIILLNPNDPTHTFAFNPLEIRCAPDDTDRELQVKIEHVVDATMLAIGAIQGGEDPETLPEYNRLMRLILHVLAENGLTLCDAYVLTDFEHAQARQALYEHSGLRSVRLAWREIERKGKKDQREFDALMRAPRNRFARFHSASLSCIVGQPTSTINFAQAMDEGAIVLVHLGSSGQSLTRTESTILGRLLLNNLTLAASSRYTKSNRPPRPLYCYIDECDRFLNNDIATAIDKLRQFGLRMILSHQSIAQLDDAGVKVRGSVLGSTATKVFFSLSDADAHTVAEQLYAGRIRLDETLAKMDKPVTVGHTIGLLEGWSQGEASGTGTGHASVTGESCSAAAGLALRGDPGFFGMGETEISHSEGSSTGTTFLESVSRSEFYSRNTSRTVSQTLIPELAWLPTQTIPLESQLFERRGQLTRMPPGRCVVALPHAVSFDAIVPHVSAPVSGDVRLQVTHDRYHRHHSDRYFPKEDIFVRLNAKPPDHNHSAQENIQDADEEDFSLAPG